MINLDLFSLTILKGIPRLFHVKWKSNPRSMSSRGKQESDQPKGKPQSSGMFMEKLINGFSTCSMDVRYKVQPKVALMISLTTVMT